MSADAFADGRMITELTLGGFLKETASGSIEADNSHGNEAAQRAWAAANVSLGAWGNLVSELHIDSEQAVNLQTPGSLGGSTNARSVYFPDLDATFMDISSVRFTLQTPNQPIRIVYDIVKETGGGAAEDHLTDQEFTLDSGNTEEVVEIPIIDSTDPDQVVTYMDNIRAFVCPYHV